MLAQVLRGLGLAPDQPEAILRSRWNEAVGEEVAKVATIDRLEGDKLTLLAENPVWNYELSMRRETLKAQLNAFLGTETIAEIRVKPRRVHGG